MLTSQTLAAKLICWVLLFCLNGLNRATSQVRMEATGYDHNENATGYQFYGMATLPDKSRIPYSQIKGSPYWKDAWQLATLYSSALKLSTLPVRLNLATNEIHFLRDEKEIVLQAGNVSAILFHPGSDVSRTVERFMMNVPFMFINNKKFDGFAEVLNTGSHRLLKHVQRTVDAKDSLFGTHKKYFFRDNVFYFMLVNEKVERIKKLNKTHILQLLPSASAYTNWINENKIDFTKEADVILFLDHYNARKF